MHLSLNNSLGKWILPKEPSPFSPEATNYFSRLDAAGDTTYVDYKQPLANYIDSLVSLGGAYWDDMESSTSFVGVGIQGVTVPLRDGMTVPTNNNFVAADLDQLTGLKGDASTKYIFTGTTGADYAQDDASISFYRTEGFSGSGIATNSSTDGMSIRAFSDGDTSTGRVRLRGNVTDLTIGLGFNGASRNNSADFDSILNGTFRTLASPSVTPDTGELRLFQDNTGGRQSQSRIATYHAGPALNLATLEGLQATLLAEIATVNLILDEYPNAAAAYSLRLLSSSFSNNAVVRVRRDSDNAELDFTATEVSDGTMLTWVGTGGTDNGFVETWYDQSGNANNATQTTATSQPKIVIAGVATTKNSKPTIKWDGINDQLVLPIPMTKDVFFVSRVAAVASGGTNPGIWGNGPVSGAVVGRLFEFYLNATSKTMRLRNVDNTGTVDMTSANSLAGILDVSSFWSSAADSPRYGINGETEIAATADTDWTLDPILFSTGTAAGRWLNDSMSEWVLWGSDQAANRTGIESNINTEYTIY